MAGRLSIPPLSYLPRALLADAPALRVNSAPPPSAATRASGQPSPHAEAGNPPPPPGHCAASPRWNAFFGFVGGQNHQQQNQRPRFLCSRARGSADVAGSLDPCPPNSPISCCNGSPKAGERDGMPGEGAMPFSAIVRRDEKARPLAPRKVSVAGRQSPGTAVNKFYFTPNRSLRVGLQARISSSRGVTAAVRAPPRLKHLSVVFQATGCPPYCY